jgi:hypothetical protein
MLKLGKRPARPGAVSFKFGAYFNRAKLPTPPLAFGHERIGVPWGVFANDDFGDCVWAGAAHETMVWTHEGGKTAKFTTDNVLADYAAVTGFNRDDPNTDQGTDMTEAASYRRKVGVVDASGVRHRIDSYLALRAGNVPDLVQATYLAGVAAVGLQFPESAMDQFDKGERWTVVKGASGLGGHYVPAIGRNHNGDILVVTWGRIHAMAPEFYQNYCDEALVYISREMMTDGKTPEGFDADALSRDLNSLRA